MKEIFNCAEKAKNFMILYNKEEKLKKLEKFHTNLLKSGNILDSN